MESRPEYADRIQADDRRVRFFEDHMGADETTTGSTETSSPAAAEATHSGIPGTEGESSREEDKPQDDDMGIPQATEDTVDQTTMTTTEASDTTRQGEQDKPMESASPAEQPQEEKNNTKSSSSSSKNEYNKPTKRRADNEPQGVRRQRPQETTREKHDIR